MTDRVLIVDGDRETTSLLSTALSGLGYAVAVADSGREAFRLMDAAVDGPALVFIGDRLSDTDPLDCFLRLRRAANRKLVGVLMASMANLNTVTDAISVGIERVLSKPVDLEEVLPLLEPAAVAA